MKLNKKCRRHPENMPYLKPTNNCLFCWRNYYLWLSPTVKGKKNTPEEILLARIFGEKIYI